MTTEPKMTPTEIRWQTQQAINYWKLSEEFDRSPASRDWYRRRFEMAIQLLLRCVGRDEIVANLGQSGQNGGWELYDVREIIERLAAECGAKVANVKACGEAAGQPKPEPAPQPDLEMLMRYLVEATRYLVGAIKLLQGTPSTEAVEVAKPF